MCKLTQLFIIRCPHSQTNCNNKMFTVNNHVQLAKSHGESTLEQVVSLSVHKLISGFPSSINLQTFGKPMAVTNCTRATVDAILPIFTAQKVMDLQIAKNMSNRQLIEVLKHLRSTLE